MPADALPEDGSPFKRSFDAARPVRRYQGSSQRWHENGAPVVQGTSRSSGWSTPAASRRGFTRGIMSRRPDLLTHGPDQPASGNASTLGATAPALRHRATTLTQRDLPMTQSRRVPLARLRNATSSSVNSDRRNEARRRGRAVAPTRWGCWPMACPQGRRGGFVGRAQTACRASIAATAACRRGSNPAGSPSLRRGPGGKRACRPERPDRAVAEFPAAEVRQDLPAIKAPGPDPVLRTLGHRPPSLATSVGYP